MKSTKDQIVLQAPLGDWLVAAREGGSRLFMLTPLARWVWEACQAGIGEEETGRALAMHFGLSEEKAISDAKGFFAQWRRELFEEIPDIADGLSQASWKEPGASLTMPTCHRRRLRLTSATVEVCVRDREISELFNSILGDFQVQDRKAADHLVHLEGTLASWFLYVDGVMHASGSGADEAVVLTFSELVALGCRARKRLLVLHAAGLVARDDFGVVLIGRSGSGKTTLAAALNAADYAFLGDDVVPVTPEGLLVGLGMSSCLKEGSWFVLNGRLPALENAKILNRYGQRVRFVAPRGPKVEQPVPLGLFLFPEFVAGSQARVERLPPEEVLRRITEANLVLPELTQESLGALVRWVASAPAFSLVYPDLESGLSLVRERVAEAAGSDRSPVGIACA